MSVSIQIQGIKLDEMELASERQVSDVLQAWAELYRSAMQERFRTFSRGGGDWKPLSSGYLDALAEEAGKDGKKKVYGLGKYQGRGKKILIDTGMLFHSLDPEFSAAQTSGGAMEMNTFEVAVSFSPSLMHKPKDGVKKSEPVTMLELAEKHHFGQGVPSRKILVEPDSETLELMKQAAEDILSGRDR